MALTTLLCSSYATADISYQPKIGLEYINYELQIDDGGSPATATIPAVTLGLSVIHSEKWYLDFDLSFGQGEVSNFYPEDDYIDHGALTISIGKALVPATQFMAA